MDWESRCVWKPNSANYLKLSGKPSGYFPIQFYFTNCELSDSIIAAAYCKTSALGWVMDDPPEETDGHEHTVVHIHIPVYN